MSDSPQASPADAPTEPTPAKADLSPAACAAALAERFPAVFGAGVALPLKLRIQADIQQRAPGIFTRRSLSAYLHRHTTSTAYLKALSKAVQRFDLDGAPAGDLAEEHRAAAAAELERRRELHLGRRRDERAAAREAQDKVRREEGEAAGRARADRAALLRAHEASTLTRKNFCALKGVAEADLDALLAQARQERAQQFQRMTASAAATPSDAAATGPGQRARRPMR